MAKQSEKTWYKLDNPYLTNDQKVVVEGWFQFPGDVMVYTFWVMAILSVLYQLPLIYVVFLPVLLNIVAGLLNWYFPRSNITTTLGLSIFHPFITGLVGAVVGVYLFLQGAIILAVISAFVGMFGFLFLELHILMYSFLAKRYSMHPKYVFAKRELNVSFPFENE